MKENLFRALTALAAICTFGASLGDYLNYLPAEYAKIGFILLAGLMGLKEIIVIVGDIADDGKRNGSYRIPLIAAACLLPSLLMLSSCAMRADGTKTFGGLDASEWGAVGISAGKGAITQALPVYLDQRRATSAKDVQVVTP